MLSITYQTLYSGRLVYSLVSTPREQALHTNFPYRHSANTLQSVGRYPSLEPEDPSLGVVRVPILHRKLARVSVEAKISVASAQMLFIALGRHLMWTSVKEIQLAAGADLAL